MSLLSYAADHAAYFNRRPVIAVSDPLLRRRLRQARRQLSRREQQDHAKAVASRFVRCGLGHAAHRIALYIPTGGELDPWPILQRLHRNRRWYLPVLRGHAPGRLWFVRHRPGAPLRANRFGIPEPARRNRQILPTHGLDLVLVPLVGFDRHCHRIGMGAGFYDRSLAFLRGRRYWQRPRLIGLAHECQRLETIDPKPWDVPLDAVITETSLYRRR